MAEQASTAIGLVLSDAEVAAATAARDAPRSVKINGKEIDLRPALPLTVDDWEQLEKVGVDLFKVRAENLTAGMIRKVAKFIVQKADPSVTDEQVGKLPGRTAARMLNLALEDDANPSS